MDMVIINHIMHKIIELYQTVGIVPNCNGSPKNINYDGIPVGFKWIASAAENERLIQKLAKEPETS